MFAPRTPLYLQSIAPGVETVDNETRKILTLEFMAQPFTRELANELGVATDVFEGNSGNPNDILITAKLAIAMPQQRMSIAMAPDAAPSIVIERVDIGQSVTIRKDKEGPVLAARFDVTCRYPSGDDLLTIMSNYRECLWLTFETEQGSLGLDEPEPDAPPKRRAKKANGAAEDAATA